MFDKQLDLLRDIESQKDLLFLFTLALAFQLHAKRSQNLLKSLPERACDALTGSESSNFRFGVLSVTAFSENIMILVLP